MYKIICIYVLFVSLTCYTQTFADKDYYLIDSLELEELSDSHKELIEESLKEFYSFEDDTSKIHAVEVIVENCWNQKVWPKYNLWVYNTTKEKLNEFPNLIVKKSLTKSLASATNNIGYYYGEQGNVKRQLYYYEKALLMLSNLNDVDGMATVINNIGFIYFSQGKIPTCLIYYNKSLEIRENLGNEKGVAESLNNIAFVYDQQEEFKLSREYYEKACVIFFELGDDYGIGAVLNNLGYISLQENNYEKALEEFETALKHKKKIGEKIGISGAYNNIGYVYQIKKDYTKALVFYDKALVIREELNYKQGIAVTLNNIGAIELEKGNLSKAESYSKKSLLLAQELGYPIEIKRASSVLSRIYEAQNKGMEALGMQILFIEMRDSLKNEESLRATIKIQAKFEYEKQKELDYQKNKKKIDLEKEQKEKQKIIAITTSVGLVLVIVFLVFIFNRLHITKKQKKIIEKQKREVENQKEVIIESHKEITDSINYAKRLQDAILPSFEEIDSHILNSFILFKPKDVVSGDFYWFEHINGTSYLASADCTGHGVPGAMVSVVCSNALNRSVKEFGIREPSKILDKTRELVIETFSKSGDGVKDGMDIALCAFKRNSVVYSGANNPLWIVRNLKLLTELQKEAKSTVIINNLALVEFKANRQPIGLYEGMRNFTQLEIKLFEGDNLYFFTDGFADQFGGGKGKKFKYKPFKKLLIGLYSKPINEQKQEISDMFEDWRGDIEQIDDVCVIGVKI